ncbi:hypothetical protein [Dyadobacter sp. CY323]|uniref:hypothetical protein n=1 Tax=Dyadobacter sp. CY323 TaxID=2907302 RepID=UPI001F428915|nr:hypothetical protein [Dyadobacter sp. CY323]MCE6989907.1 hypothetical protein [Dyadobacter sp. CY323]
MNQTFDIHRFALMLKLDLAEKGRNMLLLATLLVVMLLLMLLPITMSREPSGLREALHYVALFTVVLFGGSFYSSNALTQYSTPQTCIAALMVPASRVEKYLSSFILNVIFVVPFLILFVKLHHYTIDIGNSKLPAGGYKYNYIQNEPLQYFYFCYFILHSVIFLGSVYFPKASYIKTATFVLITILVVFGVNTLIASLFTGFPKKIVAFPMTGWRIWESDTMSLTKNVHEKFFHVLIPETTDNLLRVFAVLVALSFWFIAYIRLKEKEI